MSTSGQKPPTPRQFSFPDIRQATDDFSHVIGEGGEGTVYKGFLPVDAVGGTTNSGSNRNARKPVAVKRLKPQNSLQFQEEIETLSLLNHSNLVSLLGYCQDSGERIVVYDYMHNGSLADFLYKDGKAPSPSWELRLGICIDAARGLEYLHTGTTLPKGILHRDVKPGNILLDENWGAKISDFGLLKLSRENQTHSTMSTNLKGSPGYFAPEYLRYRQVTRKIDVYAFGAVMFEVLCKKTPWQREFSYYPDEDKDEDLGSWARQNIDPDLQGTISTRSLETYTELLGQCLQGKPQHRPDMSRVVKELERALKLQGYPEAQKLQRSSDTIHSKDLIFFFEGCNYAFDVEELLGADTEILGKGTSRSYKAVLGDGTCLVVKRLKNLRVGEVEFEGLMKILGSIKHENVVELRGYHSFKDEKLILRDFYSQGSVDAMLHGNREENGIPLSWETRLRIAIGAARGIARIHSEPGWKLVHGNVKSSNVFLNPQGYGCVADVGLSMITSSFAPVIPRDVGYRAPEVAYPPMVSQPSDVFSFGVLLLVLLTGKLSLHTLPGAGGDRYVHLARWVQSVAQEEWTTKVFDVNLLKYPNVEEGMVETLQIALSCVSTLPERRPKMAEVLRMVEGVRRLDEFVNPNPSGGILGNSSPGREVLEAESPAPLAL